MKILTDVTTMIDLLTFRAQELPETMVYTFLKNGIEEEDTRTYGELDGNARIIGGAVQQFADTGDRALLLYPAGLSYVDAFFGALYSGVIAVTAYPPTYNARNERLVSIMNDCGPRVILTTSDIMKNKDKLCDLIPELLSCEWINTEELTADQNTRSSQWIKPSVSENDTAFLQYTSGSTSEPKGVMVTHKNFLVNEALIKEGFGHEEGCTVVGWLPLYHDMGLIGNILQPIYLGGSCYLMSPFAFLKRPVNWLKAISKYRAHTSGGPDFAYALLNRSVKDEDIASLDLSCWKVAFNGSEPVRHGTMAAFCEKFAPAGFDSQAFFPCYGLAESTLYVSGGEKNTPPVSGNFITSDLEKKVVTSASAADDAGGAEVTTLVGSGFIRPGDYEVLIVDPAVCREVPAGNIGEIWVAGESVAKGYWQNREKTEEIFNAFTEDSNRGPFMRTGDLGFFQDGELYITGRLKELIIIRGRNLYPQDIEARVQETAPELKPGCGAAFSIETDDAEGLVIVQEVQKRVSPERIEEISRLARRTIVDTYTIDPHSVVLVKSGSVPKTTSGKIQRNKSREIYLSGEFTILHELHAPDLKEDISTGQFELPAPSLSNLEYWFSVTIGKQAGINPGEVDLNHPITMYGFDSIKTMEQSHTIEDALGISIPFQTFFESETVTDLIGAVRRLADTSVPGRDSIAAGKKPFPGVTASTPRKLTAAQQRLWFIHKIAAEKYVYNIPGCIRITGPLDISALKEAFSALQSRQEILQTRFGEKEGTPYQYIDPAVTVDLEVTDLTPLPVKERQGAFEAFKLDAARGLIDLESGPCWRAMLVKTGETEHHLIIVIHHLIADGWSLNVFINDIGNFYSAFKAGVQPELPELEVQYRDIVFPEDEPDAANLADNISYWKKKLEAGDIPLELPEDYTRPGVQTFKGARVETGFSLELVEKIKNLSRRFRVTPFTTILTGLKTLLYRYTHEETITVGAPVANRDSRDSSNLIGLFIDTLALRTRIDGNATFAEMLEQVKETVSGAFSHKDLPLARLLEEVVTGRDVSRNPLFQVMLILQSGVMRDIPVDDLVFTPSQIDNGTSKLDITLELFETRKGYEGWFEYNSDIFSAETIRRMAGHLSTLLESAAADPEEKISRLNSIPQSEYNRFISEFNNTHKEYDLDTPVFRLIEERASEHPEREAVVFRDMSVSYKELNTRANRIARLLIDRGVTPEESVGIYLDRSIDMVAAVLGVLKSGCAYVPMDPVFPADRIAYMIEDAEIRYIISEEKLREHLPEDKDIINLSLEREGLGKDAEKNPGIAVSGGQLAYTIYTSGSTGKPKGVQIEHGALVNFLLSMGEKPGLTEDDVLLGVTTLSFDISKLEIFLPLMMGAKLVVAAREEVLSGPALLTLIDNNKVSVMQATPATWKLLLESGWKGHNNLKALCGGEALPRDLAREIAKRTGALWNMYGPTETTIWSSIAHIPEDAGTISIGTPIANTGFYIIDKNGRLAPTGTAGELCISGSGLARGYFKRPELTEEKFTTIFTPEGEIKVYKTGDLVRFNARGQLEYLSRIDSQVKIRGYRIELGEIETLMKQHEKVADAVTAVREIISGEKAIVGYVICPDEKPAENELKGFLKKGLPGYMVPSVIMYLDLFPLTPNGKIDRKALPTPTGDSTQREIRESVPKNGIEKTILTCWHDVLEKKGITLDDNFFDIGGHSILLAKLHNRIETSLDISFDLLDLFTYTTVKSQAEYFHKKLSGQGTSFVLPGDSDTRYTPSENTNCDIAIVGLSCKVPGAENQQEFWENLTGGVESISRFSDEELEERGISRELLERKEYVKAWGAIEGPARFDAEFFGYTPREAEIIDPQQRIFLQECYNALEDAGYWGDQKQSTRVGVFAGAGMNTYLQTFAHEDGPDKLATNYQNMISNDKDFLATRIAYKLNLQGPAVTVQTACSTSLVAVHMGRESLMRGECDMVLAGGVSIRLPQDVGYIYQEGMILSPDGHCRAFDKDARGTVGGNGAGVVVLKRLEDAVRKGDPVYGIIKGSAINNDGQEKIGYTAPSVAGQAKAIREAMNAAGITGDTLSFIEAHGTGTPLGDPIEIEALTSVLDGDTDKKGFCAIGSVKTNIGHLDAAAGVMGLIKSALALKWGKIPPSLNYREGNKKINFPGTPFYVNTDLLEWDAAKGPMRCGVSSFGIGGTNAHVVLEQFADQGTPRVGDTQDGENQKYLFTLSAKNEEALERNRGALADFMEKFPQAGLGDISYTLQTGRKHHEFRKTVTGSSREEIIRRLKGDDPSAVCSGNTENRSKEGIFLFPGQGSQYVHMARELYEGEPVFTEALNRCRDILINPLERDIIDILYPAEGAGETGEIHQTEITQPVLFAIEYAMAVFLMEQGIQPAALIGHSLGEYTAACIAGVFTLEEALKTVVFRARLMNSVPPGDMLAVFAGEADTEKLISGVKNVVIAVVNTPGTTVIAGPPEDISQCKKILDGANIPYRPINTSHAFHSPMMEPILQEFKEYLKQIPLKAPVIPYISNVTGNWITEEEATSPEYWIRHLGGKVEFSKGLTTLLHNKDTTFIEVGPGSSLSSFVKHHDNKKDVFPTIRHPKEQTGDRFFLTMTLGHIWCTGINLDWNALHKGENLKRISLPGYQFEKRVFWKGKQQIRGKKQTAGNESIENRLDVNKWFSIPSWKRQPLQKNQNSGDYSNVLIIGRSGTFTSKLEEMFTAAGKNVVTALPVLEEEYKDLFHKLEEAGTLPDRIIHTLNTDAEGCLEDSFDNLLFLGKMVVRFMGKHKAALLIVSTDTQMVTGEESIDPVKAALAGPTRVIGQEEPSVITRNIDFQSRDLADTKVRKTAGAVFQETAKMEGAQYTAYRGIFRWVRDFEKIGLSTPDAAEKKVFIKEGGVYLITGGTGGIGLALAEYMAQTSKVHLVLTGRSELDERKTGRVEAIRALGSSVYTAAVDVTSGEELHRVLEKIETETGKIDGIIHAAGVPGNGLIETKNLDEAKKVLAPKIEGTNNLFNYFENRDYDFFVLFSSVTSYFGGPGQIDYTAANAFLDAFAVKHGLTAVNWDTWKETGMAVHSSGREPLIHPHPLVAGFEKTGTRSRRYFGELSLANWELKDHLIMGKPTLPGTTYIEMIHGVCRDMYPGKDIVFNEIYFLSPLMVEGSQIADVSIDITPKGDSFDFLVSSTIRGEGSGGKTTHARGSVSALDQAEIKTNEIRTNIEEIEQNCRDKEISDPEKIAHLGNITSTNEDSEDGTESDKGVDETRLVRFGPRWKNMKQIKLGDNQGIALLELPDDFDKDLDQYHLHPSLLDCAVAFLRLFKYQGIYLPLSYNNLRVYEKLPKRFYSHMTIIEDAGDKKGALNFQVILLDETGRVLVQVDRFTMREIDMESVNRSRMSAARGGMKGHEHPAAAFQRQLLETGITTSEGMNVFSRVIVSGESQLIVSPFDLEYRFYQYDELTRITAGGIHHAAGGEKVLHPRPELKNSYVPAGTEMEKKISLLWQNLLGIDKVGIQDDVFELGAHSLLLVEFHKELKEITDTEISVVDLYKYTTVELLADYLMNAGKDEGPGLEKVTERADKKKAAASRRKQALAKKKRRK